MYKKKITGILPTVRDAVSILPSLVLDSIEMLLKSGNCSNPKSIIVST